MTIHLLFPKNFDANLRSKTMAFLKKNSGCVNYIDSNAPSHLPLDENFNETEAYKICNNFRAGRKKEDFIALITNKRHEGNWFSHYDDAKNIFVSTFGIADIFDDVVDDVYIATEVISNVIHSSSQLDYTVDTEYVHFEPKGCVNDFCMNREQIILKMRSGMMCKKCHNLANQHINTMELSALLKTLSQVRQRMKSFNEIEENSLPDLYIKGSRVFLNSPNGKELLTAGRLRAFYVLLLRSENPDGLTLVDIFNMNNELLDLYRATRDSDDILKTIASFYGHKQEQRIKSIKELDQELFIQSRTHGLLTETKSKINQHIKRVLGAIPSHDYEITLSNGRYKINLDRSKIHFNQ